MKPKYIKSPLNYIGGKYKILKEIIPMFPENINTFIDLFGGGFNVGINVDANKIIYNDHIKFMKMMFIYFSKNNSLIEDVHKVIREYNLSETNKEGYLKLREEYNKTQNSLYLFVLTCFSFNHQIRFNSKHEFNTPFGENRSSYNTKIESNLIEFMEKLNEKDIEFYSEDFLYFKDYPFSQNDFVYCDPPYLISNASYNDGKRGFKNWGEKEEEELIDFLNFLNSKNIKFMLSNVIEHKGMKNEKLIEMSKKFKIKYIEKDYKNCNYHLKTKGEETKEVVIYNY